MSRYSAEQKQASRDAILNSAARLFRLKGYDGVGIPEIAQGAGLTHGTFYAHFDSKDDLLREVIEDAKQSRSRRIQASSRTGIERAKSIVNFYLGEDHAFNPDRGCIVPGLGADLARKKTEVGARSSEYVELFVEEFTGCGLRRAFARQLASTLVGGVITSRLLGKEIRGEHLRDVRLECLHAIEREKSR